MFMLGIRTMSRTIGNLIQSGVGHGLNTDGIGNHTSRLVGLLIITADGSTTIITVGCGCPATDGLRLGSNGDTTIFISVGRRCLLTPDSILISV